MLKTHCMSRCGPTRSSRVSSTKAFGTQLTSRAIEKSLPLLNARLCHNGSTDLGNFPVPPGKKLKVYAKNLRGTADGEITLSLQAVALLQKHYLLDESIPLTDLARSPPRRMEEDGARHRERQERSRRVFFYKSFVIWRTLRAKSQIQKPTKEQYLKIHVEKEFLIPIKENRASISLSTNTCVKWICLPGLWTGKPLIWKRKLPKISPSIRG